MKKIIALLLSLTLLLSLSACKSNSDTSSGTKTSIPSQTIVSGVDSDEQNTDQAIEESDTTSSLTGETNGSSTSTEQEEPAKPSTSKPSTTTSKPSSTNTTGNENKTDGNTSSNKQENDNSSAPQSGTLGGLTQNAQITDKMLKQIESGFLRLVNEEREKCGMAPLVINEYLDTAAQTRSTEIIEVWSHTRPDGTPFYSAVNKSEYPYYMISENVGMANHLNNGVFSSSADIFSGSNEHITAVYTNMFEMFKKSSGHYENIIKADFKDTGIGISHFLDPNTGVPIFYFSQIFGVKQSY